ncbi:glycosyltransferase family 2 protein [Aequorivita echinoideorum]|uniref:Glycosyltransferase n=1 Tax=Aequorivita echinoideorum TaxID=1549647 RepID=A0ABS5S5F6_9FLAO|nr:glycosyltransferase [Aequorivita echinoideorum]MBT0608453.1 glycosyltransferase [Aequorivita echinoideorum]
MDTSICIVSKNRKDDLDKTLSILKDITDISEILVFLDGCTDNSSSLKIKYPQVKWYGSEKSIGASPARKHIYAEATGELLFGFDDDAHPLNNNFVELAKRIFSERSSVAVLAFEEIKGIFENDALALEKHSANEEFLCNSFVGCGFVIRKDAYHKTGGFPDWMDIYGEEGAVSIELLDSGYDILYTSQISVNHRVDRSIRKSNRMNVFRFERQLCNMGMYFIIYYPITLLPKKLLKLFFHNFFKYGIIDSYFFWAYLKGTFTLLSKLPLAIKHRKKVSSKTIAKINKLPHPKYG